MRQTTNWLIAFVVKQSKRVLNESKIAGRDVRQCSCSEQHECGTEMSVQALKCIDSCWMQFKETVTSYHDTVTRKKPAVDMDIIVDAAAIPLKRILGTVGGFAVCVKNCFLKRNEKGFCFDRKK
ncbi:unnamed protein product [Anisakis simplex]|uniref:Uncharacterized protein n=1 Tax=Anisakis simplex TaxID=6269 RepID=A0A0M3J3E1_ANISI|nr:unnamed protein product [Anisakis simplex]